jgi:hypothetical protein
MAGVGGALSGHPGRALRAWHQIFRGLLAGQSGWWKLPARLQRGGHRPRLIMIFFMVMPADRRVRN